MNIQLCFKRWPLVLVCLSAVACMAWPLAAADSAWETSPYSMRVWLMFAPETGFSPTGETEFRRACGACAETLMGAAGSVHCEAPPEAVAREAMADFGRLTGARLAPAELAHNDKLFLVIVQQVAGGFRVRAREYDVRTAALGEMAERTARTANQLPTVAADMLLAVFRPLARLEGPQGESVRLHLRASALVVDERSAAAAPANSIFQPYVNMAPTAGAETLAAWRVVPWTYVRVELQTAAGWQGKIITGTSQPLPSRRDTERLALLVKPLGKSTEVRLHAPDTAAESGQAGKPLVGYELREARKAAGPLELLGQTNALGRLVVAANEQPLRELTVVSGTATLAKLPLVPGLSAVETVIVSDDDPRREAEGFLRALEGRMLDLLAQRTELVQRAKRRAAERKAAEVEQIVKQLRGLPTHDDLARALEAGRRRITPSQGAAREKVEKMFTEARQQLDSFLAKNPLDEVQALVGGGG